MRIKRFRWFWVRFAAISLVWMVLPAFAAEKPVSEGKVASVNGVVITRGDFDREMIRVYRQLAGQGKPVSDVQLPDVKKAVLETLINRELLYQKSQKEGIKVEDKVFNEEFDILKKRFSSEDEFKTALLNMKVSETELKIQMRKSMAVQQFVDKEFVQKITVPETEVKAFYVSHPNSFREPEQVWAKHILIKVGPGEDESKKVAARKKLKEIEKRLKTGGDFEALAKEYSECPSSSKGGDLGYFRRGQMVKPFEEAALGLAPGKVSNIIETRFGYHLIKVIDKKPETKIEYEQVKDELQEYLKQESVQEQVNIYIEVLKDEAKVKRFPDKNS
ncbi:MAG: peptidylprolyl isomerase [Pseudomonadota bacterium]|uniref:Peptidylprolyl isomerase n=1 Tax=Candidatus Desulfatibia profunda TaxID=2841695 RepID=A0A8J6TL72_9BACT|nr:peptidylprolyl isomerase [Candidatus Desulfatibia profunda]MBL7179094.1 peptidylprolyl isomerase [Desulfobacterales bacterium]